ncbi:serine/threonine-protein kinase [Actinomadura atramentaria]|uniref:serine/threonine-protein kinase n=1 Tax=Actinomadura atramentaria TaxID=1990 RepID=UPI000475AF09|nr:serine/threonine-protein kinase [Actinomadura atramentaria]
MGLEGLIPLARRYRLLAAVGRGGMGTVWRAHDELLDREVAVKEVRLPGRLSEGERRILCRRLLGEARATAALRHPGVVAVHDVVVEDGRPWIVMEFVRARSLQEVVAEDGPISPVRAAEIGRAVLSVLRAAHGRGILHRDVKPSNILIANDGRVLLTDFGLATHMERGQQIAETLVAGIEGSPAYLAPERVLGEDAGEASDLWSLGVTLYTAVEGVSPFARAHALASMVAVLLGDYPPPRRAGALTPVIGALLRREPLERLTARDTARLLADVANPPLPDPRVSWPQRVGVGLAAWRPRVGAVTSVAMFAVLAVVLGAWTARWNAVGQGDAALKAVPDGAARAATYREPAGYSVDVPAGWTRRATRDGVEWTDAAGGRTLRIVPARGDALGGLRGDERAALESGVLPGYRRLRLEAMPGLGHAAAEWEFTWRGGGDEPARHGLRSRMPGFEFAFTAPDDRWTPAQRVYDQILRTFRARS